jgi:hypothetical protein
MMSDSHSPELKALKKCASNLDTALKMLDSAFVHFLRHTGFISDNIHDEILDPQSMLTEAQRAGKLVKCIENRVSQDSASFHTLLDHFKQSGVFYEPIFKKLTTEYYTACGRDVSQESSQQPPPLSPSLPSDKHHELGSECEFE